jgi:hypothetical protein
MRIEILGAESLGARGLSCIVELKDRKIVIDPGVALGYRRGGLLPHPFQIAVGAQVRKKITEALKETTDVVISHFHGDHIPLSKPNPYQLGMKEITLDKNCRVWAKGEKGISKDAKQRRKELESFLGKDLINAEGKKEGPLSFSFPVPHGQGDKGTEVMMTKIEEEGEIFVHASDIQLLDDKTTEAIIYWHPAIVLASGPPLYLPFLSSEEKGKAWKRAVRLAQEVNTLILDHHLLRSEDGIEWLEKLALATKNKVLCAADFMEVQPLFLEAWRKELYEELPVPTEWHENYAQGKASFDSYRDDGWEILRKKGRIKECKYYWSCPIRIFTNQGKLERSWIENYCLIGNKRCIRYQMDEREEFHPDNMLPNGEIRQNLA